MKRNRLIRACVWCMLVLASFPLSAATDPVLDRSGDYGKFIVYFLHLGRTSSTKKSNHGDCELLISPDGKVMMVDCGAPVQGRYVVETLEALGIDHIDYFVNSHRHHDHLGGFSQVADHAKIDRVFVGPMEGYTGKYSMQMDQRCEADGIVQTKIGDGDSFMFGRDIEVSVYHPSKTAVDSTYTTEELNNSSLALKFSYGNTTVLLCGDLYMEGEQERLDAEVKKRKAKLLALIMDRSNMLALRNIVKFAVTNKEIPSLIDKAQSHRNTEMTAFLLKWQNDH